jgi:hypothetical protein
MIFYSMEAITTFNNMNKTFDTFTTLKLLGTDSKNLINEIEAINFDIYHVVKYNDKETLFKYIGKVYDAFNEYNTKSTKENKSGIPEYTYNLAVNNLHNIFMENDYSPLMHNIIQYLMKAKKTLENVKYDTYLINGDMSLDIFVNKENDKILLHDWNAAKDEAYELELATFLVNLFFHCKYRKIVNFNVKMSELKELVRKIV